MTKTSKLVWTGLIGVVLIVAALGVWATYTIKNMDVDDAERIVNSDAVRPILDKAGEAVDKSETAEKISDVIQDAVLSPEEEAAKDRAETERIDSLRASCTSPRRDRAIKLITDANTKLRAAKTEEDFSVLRRKRSYVLGNLSAGCKSVESIAKLIDEDITYKNSQE